MFTPIRTERLLLRPMQRDDLASVVTRRNDPVVSRQQDWALPYPRQRAEQLIEAVVKMDGPANDEWYMVAIADADTGVVVGDLALRLTWQSRTAEIGYTLASECWGRGYATEAAGALVIYLFEDLEVTRVCGVLHPDNRASAMVLERNGFLYEGRTRLSHWVGDENTDDWIYGLTRDDWETWHNRPRQVPAEVTLVPIDQSNEADVFRLRTHKTQEVFVAPMAASYADALFPELVDGEPLVPWLRAVHADGQLVGFVMLALTTEHHPEPYLWRLLIDRLHQRRGIGRRVLDLMVDTCRSMGDSSLLTSWTQGRGSPAPFYLSYGFEPTGNVVDGEIEARLRFRPPIGAADGGHDGRADLRQ